MSAFANLCLNCMTREVAGEFSDENGEGFCSNECYTAANEECADCFDEDGEPHGSYDLSDDGDALASAGMGTDEDYGYGSELDNDYWEFDG